MHRVLVIDDSSLVLGWMEAVLEKHGFNVRGSTDGQRALEQMGDFEPEVVITDLEMPEMSGIDVVRQVRQSAPATPVLILTDHGEVPVVVEAMREGAFGYLRKGVGDGVLVEEIRQACAHRALLLRHAELEEANRRYQSHLEQMVEEKTREVLRLQRAQAQSEKMAALGTLLAGVAHEINNPLAVIQSNARWMQQALARDEEEEIATFPQVLVDVVQSSERIDRLIARLRRIIYPGEATGSCDLRVAMDQVEILCRPQLIGRAQLSRIIDVELSELAVAEDDLVSAISNLVVNASHAVKPGEGRIEVEVTRAGAGWVHICVSDNGCGIPNENLAKVFNPFFTTKAPGQGTGLGLSLVYQIVQAARGEVAIESELGKGTRVTLKLPDGTATLPPARG